MRLAFWSAALAGGIACGLHAGLVPLLALASAGCAALVTLLWLRSWNLGSGLVALLLGLALGWQEARLASAPAPVAEDQPVLVLAQVVQGSDVAEAAAEATVAPGGEDGGVAQPAGRSHLRLRVAAIDGRPVAAELSLTVLGGVPEVAPGDWVRFSARLYRPRGFANPGLPDARLLARGRGIDLLACVRRPSDLVAAEGPRGPLAHARRWAFDLRQALAAAVDRRLREPAAGFVRTMVVGERTVVPLWVEEGFRAAGATHVLSVSGLHLAVVVALVFHLLRWLAARSPSWALRLPPKVLASALALPATAFYTLVTGEAVATVRSAIMAGVVLGAAVVNRPASLASSLGAAALLLLVASPAAVLDVSFQLSFASVVGLGLFARRLRPSGPGPGSGGWRSGWRWLRRSLAASFAACLLTMPIVAHHFGEITPAAPLGNLVLVPIVEILVLPCGLVGASAGARASLAGGAATLGSRVERALGAWPGRAVPRLGARVLRPLPEYARNPVAGRGRSLRAAGTRARAPALETVVGCRGGGRGTGHGEPWRPRGRSSWPGGAAGDFPRCGAGRRRLDRRPARIHRLGRRRWTLRRKLRHRGAHRRAGAARRRCRPARPGRAFPCASRSSERPAPHPRAFFRRRAVDPRGRRSQSRLRSAARVGRAAFRPATAAGAADVERSRGRGSGAVARGTDRGAAGAFDQRCFAGAGAKLPGRRVLLPGDIGGEGEAELLDRRGEGLDLDADLLKVPHHGSRHASTAPFLDAVSPKLAVFTVGRFNRFGLPSPGAVARYRERGVELRRTDRDGAVTVTVGREGALAVTCARGCGP